MKINTALAEQKYGYNADQIATSKRNSDARNAAAQKFNPLPTTMMS
jgi:hypothetical protein